MITVGYAVEGATDAPVAARLIEMCGGVPQRRLIARSKQRLDPKIAGIRRSATPFGPWLILRDLDHDAPCAAALVDSLTPHPSEYAELRIAVRQIEAWLLADRKGFSTAFSVAETRLPVDPDSCDDAKRVVVDVCQRSRTSHVRADMTPRPGSRRRVGPGYEGRLIAFAESLWDPQRARHHSDSLDRAITRVEDLVRRCGGS